MGMKAAKNCLDLGMVVKDIGASLAFYSELLGLKKIEVLPTPFGKLHRLAYGDSFLKLIDPKKLPEGGPKGLTAQLGFRYLTFQVSNIDEICAECENAGMKFEMANQELMPGVKVAMVLDPDGNVVEFVQRA